MRPLLNNAVELRHLRYFVAVAEELNFSRAAERLHMAQPPLSQQIQKLELLLGVELFERTSRGVRLTEAARQMLPKARVALTAADEAAQTARRAARGEHGLVRLAFNLTAGWEAVPTLLAAARCELPDVQVIASEAWRGDAMPALTAEHFDVGIAPLADRSWPAGLAFELLRDEPLMLAVGPNHRLAGSATLPLRALADETFVTFGQTAPAFHEMVLKLCREAGFEPKLAEQELLPPAGWRTLAAGSSVMFISRAAAPFAVAAGATPLAVEPVPTIPLELFWRERDTPPAVERFVELARRVSQTHGWRTPRAASPVSAAA